jgi:hypothetical protein
VDVSVRVGKEKFLILTVRAKMLTCLAPSSMAQSVVVPLDLEELAELRLAATSGPQLE